MDSDKISVDQYDHVFEAESLTTIATQTGARLTLALPAVLLSFNESGVMCWQGRECLSCFLLVHRVNVFLSAVHCHVHRLTFLLFFVEILLKYTHMHRNTRRHQRGRWRTGSDLHLLPDRNKLQNGRQATSQDALTMTGCRCPKLAGRASNFKEQQLPLWKTSATQAGGEVWSLCCLLSGLTKDYWGKASGISGK